MANDYGGINLSELMKIAGSPAGQELMALIQEKKDAHFEEAMQQAQTGDFSQAKQVLSQMLSSKEAQELLKKIRGSQ